MSCERWNESLVGHLFGELKPEDETAVQDHLASCERCRHELEELAGARLLLQEANAEVPAAPRVLVLRPSPRRHWVLPFAAGFLLTAVLVGAGLIAGWQFATSRAGAPGLTAAGGYGDEGAPDVIIPAEFEQRYDARLAALQQRLEEQNGVLQTLSELPVRRVLTRDEFESSLARVQRETKRRDQAIAEFLFSELENVEERTDARIGQTNEALRYVVLASDPRFSEQ